MTDNELPTHTVAGSWWTSTRIVVAAVLAAVLLGGGVTAYVLSRNDSGSSGSSPTVDLVAPAVLVAAREMATAFFSLDYRHAQDDINGVLAASTGDFKKQYQASSSQVVAQVLAKKLVSTASIPKDGVAVEFARGNRALVLVVVDVTRKIGATTDNLRNRARIQLVKVGGRWLAAGVNQVG